MSISYKEVTELLSTFQEPGTPENNPSEIPELSSTSSSQALDHSIMDSGMNISALSLENCGAEELMHCYHLALEFGVPTARRALALYQSRSSRGLTIRKKG